MWKISFQILEEEMIMGQGGINDIPLLLFSESISYYIYLIQRY